MLKKLSFIIVFVMITFSLQSHSKTPQSETAKAVHFATGVDRSSVIAYAKKYLGTVYLHAGNSPATGFDCSGFVNFVFKKFNNVLPRGSGDYKTLGKALKPEEFKEGDVLVFYGFRDNSRIGHVGIICEANGMKSKFIHSSSGKAHGVTISDLGSEMYTRRFYKCVDVIH